MKYVTAENESEQLAFKSNLINFHQYMDIHLIYSVKLY
jgi:hypothetical protein